MSVAPLPTLRFACVLAVVLLLAGIAALPSAASRPKPTSIDTMLREVNAARAAQGRRPVAFDPKLTLTAQGHTQRMSVLRRLSHEGFARRMRALGGEGYRFVVENVASGTGSPSATVKCWLSSPKHRANMLQPTVTSAGVGHAGRYWTLILATPATNIASLRR